MLCFLSVRKLRPGSYDAFREAWAPPGGPPEEIKRIYHVRSLNDENLVASLGVAEMDRGDLDGFRDRLRADEEERQRRMSEHVEQALVDDVFEVVEEIEPAKA